MKRFVVLLALPALFIGCHKDQTDDVAASFAKAVRDKKVYWVVSSMSGGSTGKTPIGVGSGSPLYIDPPDGADFSTPVNGELSDSSPGFGLTVTVQGTAYGCWSNTNPPTCTVVVTTDYKPGSAYATLTFTADRSNMKFHWNDGHGGNTFDNSNWKKFGRHAWGFDPGNNQTVQITAVTINGGNAIPLSGGTRMIKIDQ